MLLTNSIPKLPNSKLPCEAPRESSLHCQACAVQFMQCGEAREMQAERSLHETWTTRSSPSYTRSNCRPAYPSKNEWLLVSRRQVPTKKPGRMYANHQLGQLGSKQLLKKMAQMRVPSLEPPTPPYHVKSTAKFVSAPYDWLDPLTTSLRRQTRFEKKWLLFDPSYPAVSPSSLVFLQQQPSPKPLDHLFTLPSISQLEHFPRLQFSTCPRCKCYSSSLELHL